MWDIPDKVANSGVSLAGKHTHGEFNNRQHELETAVTAAGITLTTYPVDPNSTADTDETMLAQSMARMASLGVYATDSGVANAYVLSATGDVVAPKALFDGLRAIWRPGHTNTTTATVNAFGLGAKAVRTWDDAALAGDELIEDRDTETIYLTAANGGAGAWLIMPWADPVTVPNVNTTSLAGRLQVYSTPGTYTFTVPDGITQVMVEVIAGGGAGGASADGTSGSIAGNCGAGGGGGGFSKKLCTVTPAGTVTVTVGAGGSGATNTAGTAGGSSSFGAFCSATGGSGGARGISTNSAGGSGGSATGGDFNITGAGGGLSGNNSASASTSAEVALYNVGGIAAGGYSVPKLAQTGSAGGGFGTGGTGASGGSGVKGGDGADGLVIVRW